MAGEVLKSNAITVLRLILCHKVTRLLTLCAVFVFAGSLLILELHGPAQLSFAEIFRFTADDPIELWFRLALALHFSLLSFAAADSHRAKTWATWGSIFLVAIEFVVCLLTSLGVGIPVIELGPAHLVYQKHFTLIWRSFLLLYLLFFCTLLSARLSWIRERTNCFSFAFISVFVPLFCVYLSNGYTRFGGDNTYNTLLPQHLLDGGSFPFDDAFVEKWGTWGLAKRVDGYVPLWPIGPALFAFPTAVIQNALGLKPDVFSAAWNQKVACAWMAALAGALVFHLLTLRGLSLFWAATLLLGFAFGSPQANVTSITLWQQGPAVLLITLALWAFVKAETAGPQFIGAAAAALSFLPLVRPQAALFCAAGFLATAFISPKSLLRFVIFSVPGAALVLWFNMRFYVNALGGYGHFAKGGELGGDFFGGLFGLLFSPNRGYFVFSPFVILALPALWQALRCLKPLELSFSFACFAYFVLHAIFCQWWAGWVSGARYLAEPTPVVILLIGAWLQVRKTRPRQVICAVLIFASICISLPGMFFAHEQLQWNTFPDIQKRPDRAWDMRDWLPFYFRHWLRFTRFKEVPARTFVANQDLFSVPDDKLRYRVIARKDKRVFFIPPLRLKRGNYKLVFKGENKSSKPAVLSLIAEFIFQEFQRPEIAIPAKELFDVEYRFQISQPTFVSIEANLRSDRYVSFSTIHLTKE